MNKNKDGYYRESFSFAGKRYNVRAKTQRDLWRKVEEKKRRLEQGIDIINENTTVDKWFTDYLETYKKTTVANSTYRNMVGMQKIISLRSSGICGCAMLSQRIYSVL